MDMAHVVGENLDAVLALALNAGSEIAPTLKLLLKDSGLFQMIDVAAICETPKIAAVPPRARLRGPSPATAAGAEAEAERNGRRGRIRINDDDAPRGTDNIAGAGMAA